MVAKVKAIAECRRTDGTPRFDTIVVAGRDNEKQANAALGNKSEIRVKNLDAEDVEAIA
jgi:saccharopine dehydrogenase-like NADP-dependent oxidoreductase